MQVLTGQNIERATRFARRRLKQMTLLFAINLNSNQRLGNILEGEKSFDHERFDFGIKKNYETRLCPS
jgi:hypothetical protein